MRRCVVGSLRSVRGPVALLAAGLATMSLVAVSASPADAATDSVTTCAGSGAGSLPAVVSAALPNDVITFAVTCPPGSPILLTGGTIDISKNLTIQGPGPSQLAVDGQDAVQDFHVDAGYSVTISGITIQNGHIGCGGFCSGAGVENEGTLALTDDVVTNNSVKCGGSCGADGGGVENDTGGTLAITDSTITDNTVSAGCGMGDSCGAYGGGVENQAGGTLTVTDSTISDNTTNPAGGGGNCYQYCTGSGAGIDNNGKATVSFSTVSGNQADNSCTQYCGPDGGGIDNESPGTLTLFNSTVAANQANTGCDQYCGAAGGGIYNSGSATVSNATVSGNSVSGGCTTPPGDCGNIASDIDFHDGNLTITATIVANGTGATDCAGTFETDDGYNLDDDGSCGFSTANNDLPDTPSGLDPAGLQDNGGPTQTIELEATSAAVDHVAAAFCPATDQRHSPRVAPCDIGAYDTDGALMDGSQVHDVIEVKTSPSYAGDPVHIDSSQLQESCEGTITFETLQGGTTRAPRTSIDSITVVLDDDGDATVVVDGSPCAPGSDVVEADLTVAPYLTALDVLQVEPPVVTPEGIDVYPNDEVETGDTNASGESDVYAVFYVETSPVYAEQPVEISSPELDSRCGQGWRWEPGDGAPVNQASGTTTVTGTLDDDGNAAFVFKGASCAAGTSTVIADVMAGTHPTYVGTYTIDQPTATFPTGGPALAAGTKKAKAHGPKRSKKHHHKGAGSGTGSGSGSASPLMTVDTNPNPLVETGTSTLPPALPETLNIVKCDNHGGTSGPPPETGEVGAEGWITYTITVSNNGTTAANGVVVNDTFNTNPNLEGDSYTAAAGRGTPTGYTAVATGTPYANIDDTVNLPPGSSIIYTVVAKIGGTYTPPVLTNTATLTPPAGTVLTSNSNISATDQDNIEPEYAP